MAENITILKHPSLSNSEDYKFLRAKGMEYIEALGSNLWTDYNIHDPGITLMELLAEEYRDKGISFNTLALGSVNTEMLAEAFPGYKAPIEALDMARYVADFALTGQRYFNGKTLQVSSSTP